MKTILATTAFRNPCRRENYNYIRALMRRDHHEFFEAMVDAGMFEHEYRKEAEIVTQIMGTRPDIPQPLNLRERLGTRRHSEKCGHSR